MARPRKAIVEYRIYELPSKFPVLMLSGKNWHICDVKSRRLHFHNCFEIGVCISGSGNLVIEGTELPFRTGDVTFIPKHIAHTTYSTKDTKSLWSYLFLDFNKLLGTQPEIDFYRLFSQAENGRFYFLVTSVLEELRNKSHFHEMIIKGLLSTIYYELLRFGKKLDVAQRSDTSNFYVIAPALQYMFDNFSNKLYISSLAELCHLSESHFRREFLSVMGLTPLSFLNMIRIEKVCELLVTTTDSILAVSEAAGFCSISSLNRCFAEVTGVSPRSYRENRFGNIKVKNLSILPYRGWTEAENLNDN
ncbi:MAG: AraC family transcriptional regulator [Clostridium sp.]|jgi:AraC-like DNA-binding protein|nr:AraC family transcriptional regulator [Clostridium sp.]